MTPVQLPRALTIVLGLAGAVVALAGLHAAAGFVAPVLLALTLVVSIHPLLTLLQRHRWPTWLAATVCLLILYVILLGVVVGVVLSVARFGALVPQYADKFGDLADSVSAFLTSHGLSDAQIRSAVSSIDPGKVFDVAGSLLSGLADSLTGIAVIAATFGLIVAVLDTVALYAIGVPLALVWGLLAFLTNYIPNIGFVLGLIPPALLALLEGGLGTFLLVVGIYIVLNVVIQSVIQPRFAGNAVGLTVTASFVSLLLWGYVLGPLGGLLALPMSLLVKSLLVDADPKARWVNAFISSRRV